jgi:tellurite resistance protein
MVSALLAFAGLAIGYLMKLVAAPGAVRAEFCHPITGPLFGILPITLLVLPIVLARDLPSLATASWVLGTTSSLLLVWLTVGRWFAGERTDLHAAPTWIIPAIALLDIPVAMPLLAVPQMHGLESFGFGVGLFLAVVLFTLMAGRLVFGPPLPDALQPSVLVLVAPFATGFIAYVTMMHQVDLFSKSLYVIMAFLLAVLLPRLRRLGQCCPFEVSWWAVGFPLAMACLPALYFARTEPRLHNAVIALLLLSLATVTTAWLFCQTIIGLAKASLAAPRDPASAGMKATA